MVNYLLTLLVVLGVCSGTTVQAQSGYAAWFFGRNVALKFSPGQTAPTPLNGSAMNTFEACASVADAQGNVLFYSDAERVWNRNNVLMPNGDALGGNISASQGVLIVPVVGKPDQYYLFTVDAKENNLLNGFRYSIVDMALDNGLGAVTQRGIRIPLPNDALVTEHLTAIPHSNGRDYWIVVHGFETNQFFAFTLTSAGLSSTPVVSAAGAVFTATATAQTGVLRASPDAQRLAVSRVFGGLELFDFDAATGQVSNAMELVSFPPPLPGNLEKRTLGAEFSSDGTLLYSHEGSSILQFDVKASTSTAIRASRRELGKLNNYIGHFLRGPDGRIYIAALDEPRLSTIEEPNSILGARFSYRSIAIVDRFGGRSQYGLPNYLVSPVVPPVEVQDDFQVTLEPGCVGSASRFAAYSRSTRRTLRSVTWTVSPDAAVYSGLQVAPVFTSAGSRQVQIVAMYSDGSQLTQSQQLTVVAGANLRLSAETPTGTFVCGEPSIQLTAEANTPGSYQWADDPAAAPSRRVTQPGTYRVRFAAQNGCVVTDSITIAPQNTPCTLPNIITPNGDAVNQKLVMQGFEATNWSIAIFNRWGRMVYQQASYQNDWQADGQPSGLYYYQLRHKDTHRELKGWLQVLR